MLSARILGAVEATVSMKALELGVKEETVAGVRKAAFITQKHLRLHSSGKTVGQGRGIHTKRGNLARSWQVGDIEKGSDGHASAVVGSNHPGAKILETGGPINAKKKFLTIPVHPMADRRTIRDFPTGVFVQTRRGLIFILPEAKQSTVLFVLRRSVQIPAFGYVSAAVTDAKPEVFKATDGAIDLAIRKAAS